MSDVTWNIQQRLPLLHRFREELQRPHSPEEVDNLLRGQDSDKVQTAIVRLLEALEKRETFWAIRHWRVVAPLLHAHVVVKQGVLPPDVLNPEWEERLSKAEFDLVPVRCCGNLLAMVYPGGVVRCPWCGAVHSTPPMETPKAGDSDRRHEGSGDPDDRRIAV